MPISPEAARARSRLGHAALRGDKDAQAEARRELRAAVLADHIKRAVDEAPPLTVDQRSHLADLLRGGAA